MWGCVLNIRESGATSICMEQELHMMKMMMMWRMCVSVLPKYRIHRSCVFERRHLRVAVLQRIHICPSDYVWPMWSNHRIVVHDILTSICCLALVTGWFGLYAQRAEEAIPKYMCRCVFCCLSERIWSGLATEHNLCQLSHLDRVGQISAERHMLPPEIPIKDDIRSPAV